MTYPQGRTPITADDMAKMHPSTWQQECEMLQEKVTELAMLVLAAEGQAEEAHEARLIAEASAKVLRTNCLRLIEDRDRALAWRNKDWQASQHNKALQARVAELEAALDSEHASVGYNIWRFWSDKALKYAEKNKAMRARVAKLEEALNRLSDLTARDAAIVVAALGDDQ